MRICSRHLFRINLCTSGQFCIATYLHEDKLLHDNFIRRQHWTEGYIFEGDTLEQYIFCTSKTWRECKAVQKQFFAFDSCAKVTPSKMLPCKSWKKESRLMVKLSTLFSNSTILVQFNSWKNSNCLLLRLNKITTNLVISLLIF